MSLLARAVAATAAGWISSGARVIATVTLVGYVLYFLCLEVKVSALRPTTMAAEAGEEELLGHGVPIHIDGHAGLRLEAFAQGDMEGEESDDALVGGAVVRGVLGFGL